MSHAFVYRRRVAFADTDMAGIMHFTNFFRFMEEAENAFLRSLGLTPHKDGPEGMQGYARVHAKCDYVRPLRFEDEVDIHLSVSGKDASSITYAFDFRMAEAEDGALPIARGEVRVVCVVRAPGEERLRATRLTAEFAESIELAPINPEP